MVTSTTTGLRGDGTEADELPPIPWTVAAGTADAILADYDGEVTGLTDGLVLAFRAAAANATTTPTFSPDDFTPHTITRDGGDALLPGDIAGNLAEYFVRYNLANTRWELLNPSRASGVIQWATAGGAADAITVTYDPPVTALTDGLILAFRAAAVNATATPTFSPNGLTARTIVKAGGSEVVPGDIPAANAECFVRYNLANTRWELLNPADTSGELFRVLITHTAAEDTSSAQPWFPSTGSANVAANTTYFFEGFLHFSRTAGTVSHTTGILFGGTATLTSIRYVATCKEGDANDLQDFSGFVAGAATLLTLKAASTSATENVIIRVTGTVRINAAGTFIPQFKFSAAPGGAPSVHTNTFFRMKPIGNVNVVSKGSWA